MSLKSSVIALLIGVWSIPALAVEAGDAAPAWVGSDVRGDAVSFPEISRGNPAVVVFWATWCPYCKAFMPYLDKVQSDYAADGVQIIAINAKERGIGDPVAYLDSLAFPVLGILEGDDIADAYDIQFIPGLMVVDGNGVVSYRRASTDLPPGKTLSEFWDTEVREALDDALR
jgi:thiol-disulfide isomerase/thioredoxin